MRKASIVVRAQWDDEAAVWVATSDDVPGLATEAETHEELMEKLKIMIPDLLEMNAGDFQGAPEVPLVVMSEHIATIRL